MKLLIDECLSEELAKLARERGHAESSHVLWIGKRGWKDWNLMPLILAGDWTFVTANSIDFRGPPRSPGSKGHHSRAALHAGLICLYAPRMDLDAQLRLFGIALDAIDALGPGGDLINRAIEVNRIDDAVEILRYELPRP